MATPIAITCGRDLPAYATPIQDPVPVTHFVRVSMAGYKLDRGGHPIDSQKGRLIPMSLPRVKGYYEVPSQEVREG
jgi:hypothetical protein